MRHLSVLHGRDPEALRILLQMHAQPTSRILDVTHNKGTMWAGLPRPHITMDIDPSHGTDIVGDFADIPLPNGHVEVIVFDPPHLPVSAASAGSSKIYGRRYGITQDGAGRRGDNVSGMFMPFLLEAKRVLTPGGIALCKIADIVHSHRYQWHHVDLINAAMSVGMAPCDMLIKIDPSAGKLMSSKWNKQYHLRKAHCYWVVIRNSQKCERQ